MDAESETLIAHSLRADGFDASEDGTDRGTPLVPVEFHDAIAFSCKDTAADAREISPTLRGMEFDGSHANGGGQVAVAFYPTGGTHGVSATEECSPALKNGSGLDIPSCPAVAFRAAGQDGFTPSEITPPISASDVGGAGVPTIAFDDTQLTSPNNRSSPKPGDPRHPLAAGARPPAITSSAGMAVRRLTPRECERLQLGEGYDDYTLIPYRGKMAADGPRYKALGNAWCLPQVRRIFERIDQMEQILAEVNLLLGGLD